VSKIESQEFEDALVYAAIHGVQQSEAQTRRYAEIADKIQESKNAPHDADAGSDYDYDNYGERSIKTVKSIMSIAKICHRISEGRSKLTGDGDSSFLSKLVGRDNRAVNLTEEVKKMSLAAQVIH